MTEKAYSTIAIHGEAPLDCKIGMAGPFPAGHVGLWIDNTVNYPLVSLRMSREDARHVAEQILEWAEYEDD